MKRRLVEVELLEKGDKILLPDGGATVIEDEKFLTPGDRFSGDITIKWIDCSRPGKNGKIDTVPRDTCILMEEKKK